MRDRALIRRVLHGDHQAGERLVSEHYSGIFRLLRGLTMRPDVAEDLTQQTFIRAWQALATYRGEASFATWLHRIAYREYSHWLRETRSTSELADHVVGTEDPSAEMVDSLLLRRAMQNLTHEHREVFVLYHVEGMSVKEVADLTGVPSGTVKSRLFHARRHLRELLAGTWPAARMRCEPGHFRTGDLAEEGLLP